MKIINHLRRDAHDRPLLFTSKKYSIIVLPYNCGHPEIFMKKPNTDTYIEMCGGSGSSFGKKKSWLFQNIHSTSEHGEFYDLYSDGDYGFLKMSVDHEFMSISIADNSVLDVEYIPIPENRILEYVAHNPQKDILFTVDRPEIDWSYESFRVNMFTNGCSLKKELKVKNVVRYRDGGTTEITLEDGGFLFFPSRIGHKNDDNKWYPNGQGIEENSVELKLLSDDKDRNFINILHSKTGTHWPLIRYRK